MAAPYVSMRTDLQPARRRFLKICRGCDCSFTSPAAWERHRTQSMPKEITHNMRQRIKHRQTAAHIKRQFNPSNISREDMA